MARSKTKLRYIANDTDRRITMKKRSNGIIKKVMELSTLCDVRASAIIYDPESSTPMVWPNVHEAIRILQNFRSLPDMAQKKKMLTQEEFIYKRKDKMEEQLRRQSRESHEIELNMLVNRGLAGFSLDDLGIAEVRGVNYIIDMRRKALQERMEKIKEANGKGKAPMYANVSEQERVDRINAQMGISNFEGMRGKAMVEPATEFCPQTFWFTDAYMRDWFENDMAQKAITSSEGDRGKAPMYPATTLPPQNYSLINAAEQQWLENGKQQTAMNFYGGERGKAPMAPALTEAFTPQKYWSFDQTALNDQMTFQNNMGAVGIGGLEDAVQQYFDVGNPWGDLDLPTF